MRNAPLVRMLVAQDKADSPRAVRQAGVSALGALSALGAEFVDSADAGLGVAVFRVG